MTFRVDTDVTIGSSIGPFRIVVNSGIPEDCIMFVSEKYQDNTAGPADIVVIKNIKAD